MKYKLRIRAAARRDIVESHTWYADQSPAIRGIGSRTDEVKTRASYRRGGGRRPSICCCSAVHCACVRTAR